VRYFWIAQGGTLLCLLFLAVAAIMLTFGAFSHGFYGIGTAALLAYPLVAVVAHGAATAV
jgi:hypothetical protein